MNELMQRDVHVTVLIKKVREGNNIHYDSIFIF